MEIVFDGGVIDAGSSFYSEPWEFVDHSGTSLKMWGEHFFWHPDFYKTVGIETFGDFVKWWVKNREALLETEKISRSLLVHMFDYSVDFDLIRKRSLRWLRNELAHILDQTYGIRVVEPYTGYHDFLLCETEDPETPSRFCIDDFRSMGRLTVKAVPGTSGSETIWSKKRNYTFKMNSEEYGWFRTHKNETNAWFGLELEVSTRLSVQEIQHIITEVEPKQKPFFIFKEDSSVRGRYSNRVEIVTVPASPRYLRVNFKLFFQKLEKLCEAKNRSISEYFDTSESLSNGIHIHVDRDCFATRLSQRRFVAMWQERTRDVVRIYDMVSKRPGGVMESTYSRPSPEYKGRTIAGKLNWANPIGTARQSIVNEENRATLEVRAYQGIFDLRHLMQCISFTELMLELSHEVGYKDFGRRLPAKIFDGIKSQRKYKSLEEYAK